MCSFANCDGSRIDAQASGSEDTGVASGTHSDFANGNMNWIKTYLAEICLVLCLIGLAPLLALQAHHLWTRPHFQFFPVAWGALALLMRKRARIQNVTHQKRKLFGMAIWLLGLISAVGAGQLFSPWLAHVAAVLSITGYGLLRLGNTIAPRWLAWSLLLWVTLPLPGEFDGVFISELQRLSASSAGALLDLFGIIHLREGTLIEIRSQQLFVDEACSGIDSFYALVAIALIILLWQRHVCIVGVFTLLSVPLWAWLGNVIRLLAIVVLLDQYNIDLSRGWKHTALGFATFALSSLFMIATVRTFSLLFQRFSRRHLPNEPHFFHLLYNELVSYPDKPSIRLSDVFGRNKPDQVKPKRAANVRPYRHSLLFSMVIAMSAIGTLGLTLHGATQKPIGTALPAYSDEQVALAFKANNMPELILDARRVRMLEEKRSRESSFGEYSRTWQYSDGKHSLLLSIDFPFHGYHPLWVCYVNSGQTVVDTPEILTTTAIESSPEKPTALRVKLVDSLKNVSYLWFVLFDASGRPITAQGYDQVSVKQLLLERIQRALARQMEPAPVSYQFQLLVNSGEDLTPSEMVHYQELFESALPYAMGQVRELVK